MSRYANPFTQYLDDSGAPLDGGKLLFQATGTSTDLDTFKDVNLSIPNTNPIILDAAGRIPNIFLQSQSYKVRLSDKNDVLIKESEPIGADLATGNFSPYNNLTIYNTNDIVVGTDGLFYISITDGNVDNSPPSESNWMQVDFINTWNPNFTFAINQVALGSDGFLYTSTIANNLGNDPVSDQANWKDATAGGIPTVVLASSRIFAHRNF